MTQDQGLEQTQTGAVEEQQEETWPVYVSVKFVKAHPMDELTYLKNYENHQPNPDRQYRQGYEVLDEYGTRSWVSQQVHDSNYRRLSVSQLSLIAKEG